MIILCSNIHWISGGKLLGTGLGLSMKLHAFIFLERLGFVLDHAQADQQFVILFLNFNSLLVSFCVVTQQTFPLLLLRWGVAFVPELEDHLYMSVC